MIAVSAGTAVPTRKRPRPRRDDAGEETVAA